MEISLWLWIGFNVFVLLMLALDLGVFHRSWHTLAETDVERTLGASSGLRSRVPAASGWRSDD